MSTEVQDTLNGRPLREWLIDLASADRAVREGAGEVLRAARVGLRADAPDEEVAEIPTPEAAAAAWRDMIRRQFAAPDFPGGPTAVRLARWLLAVHTAFHARIDRGDEVEFEHEESMSAAAMAAAWVLEAVGPGAAEAVPVLIEMLEANGGHEAYLAAEALGSMGPAARAAVPALIETVRHQGANERPYRKGRALAALAGDDPSVVRRLADLVSAPEAAAREGACAALREFGARAAAAIPALIAATRHDDAETRSHAAIALSTVARDRPDIVDVLLPLTRDEAWWVRGNAVGSLGALGLRLPDLIPVFVAALSDTGGDGDWTVREQALSALADAGPQAESAVPVLLGQLRDEEGDIDADVARALGAIGPAARDALPLLTASSRELDEDTEDGYEVARAIRRIAAGSLDTRDEGTGPAS